VSIRAKYYSILKELFRKPITYILVFSFIIFTIGIFWGLPNTETWQSDSLAPFHPLLGLSKLFSFGYFNKYPIVHQVILAILDLPVIIAAMINSDPLQGFQMYKFLSVIRSAEYATALILIGRFVSVFMGVGIVYYIYKSGVELFNEKAGVFAALIVSFNSVLNYFCHIAKVEVSYIFWGVLGIYKIIQLVKYDRTRDYILCALFICLSFGSKDQGYAFFILPLIFYLLIYQIVWREEGVSVSNIVFRKKMWIFAAFFVLFTVLVENVILNYEGLLLRFEHLTGDGSTRSQSYALSLYGIYLFLKDNIYQMMEMTMGPPFFFISITGIVVFFAAVRKNRKDLFLQSIFLAASISYYIFFVQITRNLNVRFPLPRTSDQQGYMAGGLYFLYEKFKNRIFRISFTVVLVLSLFYSLYNTFSMNANFIYETRYRAEEWMGKNIRENSIIEYYSYLHYLPRFPQKVVSYRIKTRVMEIADREPDYIVLTSHYYTRYLSVEKAQKGRIRSLRNIRWKKSGFVEFFDKLFNNELNYRLEKKFTINMPKYFRKINFSRISPDHIMIYKRIKNY